MNFPPIHFGNKIRGQLDPLTESFGKGGSMKSMVEFVPSTISRRDASKLFARIFDLLGKVTAYMAKPKALLRRTVEASPGWDEPIPAELRAEWVEVFKDFGELRNIQFQRARIPMDAEEPLNVRLFAGADAWSLEFGLELRGRMGLGLVATS